MMQVLLLSSQLGTLDLNYFKNKIKNQQLHTLLFGGGYENHRKLEEAMSSIDLDSLTDFERLAIVCFAQKFTGINEEFLDETIKIKDEIINGN